MEVPETLCNHRFRLGTSLGKGTYGEVFSAVDTTSGKQCAVKLESLRVPTPQLMYEAKVLKVLQSLHGVPSLIWQGTEQGYNAVAMQLLGTSFDNLLCQCAGKFSLKTTLMVADQIIQRLESVHGLNYVHRDIKPENFAVGLHRAGNFVYIIDFGLAKKFRDPATRQHIPYRENQGLIGTVRYASVNSHMGMELSRRDDLESLMYMLIFFARGQLPWQGLMYLPKLEKYERVRQMKQNTSHESLCKGLPQEFATALRYVRGLLFDAKPDYSYLRRLMQECLTGLKLSPSLVYDWNTQEAKRSAPTPLRKARNAETLSLSSEATQVTPGPSFKREFRERLRRMRSAGYAA